MPPPLHYFCLLHSSKCKLLISLHHPLFSVCKCTSVCKTVIVICLIRLHCGICASSLYHYFYHHVVIVIQGLSCIITSLSCSSWLQSCPIPSPFQLHPSTDLFKRDSKEEIIYLHTLIWDCLADLMTGRDPVTLV